MPEGTEPATRHTGHRLNWARTTSAKTRIGMEPPQCSPGTPRGMSTHTDVHWADRG